MEESTTNEPIDENPLRANIMSSRALQLEEPAGLKSRLVIHKLMLINFKSYAGRQEIGPFHKVESTISYLSDV